MPTKVMTFPIIGKVLSYGCDHLYLVPVFATEQFNILIAYDLFVIFIRKSSPKYNLAILTAESFDVICFFCSELIQFSTIFLDRNMMVCVCFLEEFNDCQAL
jgi:hypothetical protein